MSNHFSSGKPVTVGLPSSASRPLPPKVKEGRVIPPLPERRSPVTICIAAICNDNDEHAIILCADGKEGSFLGSRENAFKIKHIQKNWLCLVAGQDNDINALVPLFRKEMRSLQTKEETNVLPAIQAALRARKTQKIESYTTLAWGMSYADFRLSRNAFPESDYEKCIRHIKSIGVEADCIICGFLDDGFPVIIHAHGDLGANLKEGYCVSGTGSFLAQSSLTYREYSELMELGTAAYCVYESKKHAEREPSVGNKTTLMVMRPDGKLYLLSEYGESQFEIKFDQFGPKHFLNHSFEIDEKHFVDLFDVEKNADGEH